MYKSCFEVFKFISVSQNIAALELQVARFKINVALLVKDQER